MAINLLALDTSSPACSVALSQDGKVTQLIEQGERQHSQHILAQIQRLLSMANMRLGQLHAVAFSCGPGSFTGIRLAASVTQGLAFAANLPILAIPTLQTIAQSTYREQGAKQVAVASNAFGGQIYWGIYQLAGEHMLPAVPDSLCAPDQAILPDEMGRIWAGAGDGWAVYEEGLAQRLVVPSLYAQQYSQACYVADLALVAFQAGHFVAAEAALPVYLYGADRWRQQTISP